MNHREIPIIPLRPCVHPISKHIIRSYPVGRQNFSRACQGEILNLSISTEEALPDQIQASLITTLNSKEGDSWIEIPFVRIDDKTLTCQIKPQYSGLHSFRAEYSIDKGASWIRDTVPDAWVLIDPPQVINLRLYTLIPTVSGTISDWTNDLKRISEMGFNCVHLLPITTLDTSESPYAAKDLFGIDESYLTEGSKTEALVQLEEFIQEAKALKIKLCFDLVLNHVGVTSNIVNRAPDWIVPDQNQPDSLQRARYWSDNRWNTWNDLVLINYEHPSDAIKSEIWAYMIDYALFWAKYANDTGGFVRFDNLHGSDPDFVQSLTKELYSKFPSLGILAEYFTDDRTLLNTVPKWGLNLVLAIPWSFKFVPELREYLNYIHRASEQVHYYMPITSHDSGTPAQEFGNENSTVPRYVTSALLGTGATGIPQGVEFGEKEKIDFIGRKPKMHYPEKSKFAEFISKVNAILIEYPAFCEGICKFVDNGHPAIIAAFRPDIKGQSYGFLVVCNFDTNLSQRILVDLEWIIGTKAPFASTDLLSGDIKFFQQSKGEILLEPCTAKVLKFPRT